MKNEGNAVPASGALPKSALGYIEVALSVCAWGTWPLWLRACDLHPVAKAFWVLVFVAILGGPLAIHAQTSRPRPTRQDWICLSIMGIAVAVNNVTYFLSLTLTSTARAVLTHYLAPVFVASLAPWILREPFDRRTPFALAASLAGLGLLLLESPAGAAPATNDAAGIAAGLTSAVFYAAITLSAKRLSPAASPPLIVAFHCVAGAALLAPFATALPFLGPPEALGLLALASLVAGLLPALAYFDGLRRIPAQHVAVLSYLEPVVAALLAWILLAEPLGALSLAGGALIVCAGIAIVRRGR